MPSEAILKKISFFVLCFLLGFVFLFSAYTKLYPVEYFEYTFVDLGFASWTTAPFFARLLIGLEAFTGILLIFQIRLRKLALPLAAGLLFIFSLHLAGQIILNGDKGNCGCFGNYLFMTPGQALIKNVIMLVLVFILWYLYSMPGWRLHWYFILGVGLFCGTMPFILNPVDLNLSASHNGLTLHYPLDLHWLYENPNDKPPSVDLYKGKHIVAFLSTICPHCRLAGYKLHVMHNLNPRLPIFLVLNSRPENLADFYNETKTNDLPSVTFRGKNYLKMSGPELPAIFFINNDTVVKKTNYVLLNQAEIEKWVAEKP